MATSREERMASRLRGAGRHQVEDISFGFVLPEAEPSIIAAPSPAADANRSISAIPPPPPPTPPPARAPRSANPNTSAKRRRIAHDDPSHEQIAARTPVAPLAPPPLPLPTTRSGRATSAARPDPYDLPDNSTEETRSRHSPRSTRSGPAADALRRSITARTPGEVEEDDLESLPRPTPRTAQRGTAVATREEVIDIVQESPANAPGSGRRRRVVRVSEVATSSSAMLQRVMQQHSHERKSPREVEAEDEDEIAAEVDVSPVLGVGSSPLIRKAAQRDRERKTVEKKREKDVRHVEKEAALQEVQKSAPKRTIRRSGLGAAGFGQGEVDELSPAPAVSASPAAGKRSVRLSAQRAQNGVDELSPAVARTMRRSVRHPPRPRAEASAVDEQSPASAKAVKRRVGPVPQSAAGEVDAPSSASTRSTRRKTGPLVDIEADELDEPSPAPARIARRSVRVSDGSAVLAEVDELSPEKTREVMGPPPARTKPPKAASKPQSPQKESLKAKRSGGQPSRAAAKPPTEVQKTQISKRQHTKVQPVEHQEEIEEAEQIDETEAARRLGRKRPRRSIQAPTEADETEQQEEEQPAAKRRRRKPPQSPAIQQPPKTRKEKQQAVAVVQPPRKSPAKRKSRTAGPTGDQDELEVDEVKGGTFPITVQRFTKKVRHDGDDGEADILGSDTIPFASRAGVNAVDVLAQMCDELVGSFLSNLQEQGRAAADAAARREVKTMMRALEAFREELRTRLLEHTIALDTLHALQKRVRAAQKDKIALREEILRIRREKEVVELRKDAVRVRHEAERGVAMQHIRLSSTMHDIDLAVEKGLAAEELSAAEQGKADLANLEFLISKVAEQACSKSGQGGTLKQIKEFNAFLERAAAALEGR